MDDSNQDASLLQSGGRFCLGNIVKIAPTVSLSQSRTTSAAVSVALPVCKLKQDSPFHDPKIKAQIAAQNAVQATVAVRPEIAAGEAARPSYFYRSIRTTISLPAGVVGSVNPASGGALDSYTLCAKKQDSITEKQVSREWRYKLHDAASELLEGVPEGRRIRTCCRHFGRGRDADGEYTVVRPATLKVEQDYDGEAHASIYNTFLCDNPACPICAGIRADEESRRLTRCFADPNMAKKINLFVTLTIGHHAGEGLAEVLSDFKEAARVMRSAKRSSPVLVKDDQGRKKTIFAVQGWAGLCAEWGIENVVRVDDFTSGDNGPHPHQHWIVTLDGEKYRPLDVEPGATVDPSWFAGYEQKFAALLFERWCMACMMQSPDRRPVEAAFDVRVAQNHQEAYERIAEYVSKFGSLPGRIDGWTDAKELAYTSAKEGKKGRTLFQLLADWMAGDDEAGRRYVEFVVARAGKRPVRGIAELEKLLGVDTSVELYPEEHCEPLSEFTIELEFETWVEICKRRLRSALLIYAEQNPTEEAINRWLYIDQGLPFSGLGYKPGLAGGTFREGVTVGPDRELVWGLMEGQ